MRFTVHRHSPIHAVTCSHVLITRHPSRSLTGSCSRAVVASVALVAVPVHVSVVGLNPQDVKNLPGAHPNHGAIVPVPDREELILIAEWLGD